jgi:sugar diacid utilization regulator
VKARFWNLTWGVMAREQIRAITNSEGVAIIAGGGSIQHLRRMHEAALGDLSRVVADGQANQLAIGVSDWVESPAELPEAYRQAQITAQVTFAISSRSVGYWSALGVYRYLGQLPAQMLLDGVDPRVRALVDESPLLSRTAHAFLENAGSASPTAKALGIHRATLYARLEKLAQRGLDVRRGEDALTLHVGLCALELLGYIKWQTSV